MKSSGKTTEIKEAMATRKIEPTSSRLSKDRHKSRNVTANAWTLRRKKNPWMKSGANNQQKSMETVSLNEPRRSKPPLRRISSLKKKKKNLVGPNATNDFCI